MLDTRPIDGENPRPDFGLWLSLVEAGDKFQYSQLPRTRALHKGTHLLVDCREVSRDVCLNDGLVLNAMATAASRAGATVLSQVRYHFGHDSPPGFTAAILLDESHCTAHSYADLGLVALDVFTCGNTDPRDVLKYMREIVDLGEVTIQVVERLEVADPPVPVTDDSAELPSGRDSDYAPAITP